MKPETREYGQLEHEDVLLYGHKVGPFITKLILALLFLFAPPLIQHASAAGYPFAAGSAPLDASPGKASPIAPFLLNDLFLRQEIDSGPISGRFTAASSVASIHVTNARLPVLGGRALVAGWVLNRRISASAELYDASTDSWLEAGSLSNTVDNRNSMFPRTSRVFVWGGIIVPF